MATPETSNKWQEFRKSRLGLVFGLVLTALLTLVLMLYGGYVFCFAPLLVAVILYLVPKYFGLKGMKKIALFGIVLLVVVGLIIGFTFFLILKDTQPAAVSSSDGILTEGRVDPFRAPEGSYFNYSVVLSGGNDTPAVWVTTYDYFASNAAKMYNLTGSYNLTEGKRVFYLEKTIPKSVYRFAFTYRLAGTNDTTSTSSAWGPFMVTDQDILVHELYYNVLYVVVNGGLWFAFVLMAAWWMESSKKRMEKLQKRKAQEKATAESKDKFVCSECGADVPGDAKECPQCGEKFDD